MARMLQTDRQTDRQTHSKSKQYPQGMIGHKVKGKLIPTEISNTLDTACGSTPGFWTTYVMEHDKRSTKTK